LSGEEEASERFTASQSGSASGACRRASPRAFWAALLLGIAAFLALFSRGAAGGGTGPRRYRPLEQEDQLLLLREDKADKEEWSVQVNSGADGNVTNYTGTHAKINFSVAADPCANYNRMRLDTVMHNNLGGKGPDSGEEGIVYQGVYVNLHSHQKPVEIEVHLNSLGTYTPNAAGENGFSKPGQKYESINIGGGTSVKVRFQVLDRATKFPITLDHLELTFFDLDTGDGGRTVESVEVNRLHSYYLTKNTEITVKNKSRVSGKYMTLTDTNCKANNLDMDLSMRPLTFQEASIICDKQPFCGGFQYHPEWEGGTVPQYFSTDYDCITGDDSAGWTAYMTDKENSWVFTATTPGDGNDNPVDPMKLTAQQRNRAVTVTFRKINEFNVTMASTAGWMPRYFTFLGRPSVLCALTSEGEEVNTKEEIDEVIVTGASQNVGEKKSEAARGLGVEDVQCCLEIFSWRTSMCSESRSWWCRSAPSGSAEEITV
jgi:hypothetical protein